MLAQAASATDAAQSETVRASASRWSVPAAGRNDRRASCLKKPWWKNAHHASVLRRTCRTQRRPWLSVMHQTPPAKSSQSLFAMLSLCCVYPCCGPCPAAARIYSDLHRSYVSAPISTLTTGAVHALPSCGNSSPASGTVYRFPSFRWAVSFARSWSRKK